MKPLSLLLLVLLVAGCKDSATTENADARLTDLFESYRDYTYYSWPEYATYNGIHDYNDRLNDQSLAFEAASLDSTEGFLKALHAINRKSLSEDQQMNYDLFEYQLKESIEGESYGIASFLGFTQQNGYHITFPQMVEVQPLNTEEDVRNYFKRLEAFPEQVNHIMDRLRKGNDKGITVYCSISDQVLAQLEGFSKMSVEDSPLYTAMEKSEVLKENEAELRDIVEKKILPAYESLYIFFRDESHPKCREGVGISSVEGGKAYYEYLVRHYTTSDMLPDEVFDIGMAEVDRVREEMISTKAEMGYGEMDLEEFFKVLRTDPKFYYTKTEDLMEGYRTILKNMDGMLPTLFGKLPKAPYDLKEIEAYRAAAAPAAYYYPVPEDNSRPGYFYVNTYQLDARPKYTMTALALHEAVPGHHLQMALANEMENVPWFRNKMSTTAFVEGWGLYAEYLGYESGMYDDPVQKMGALSFEMWRACRLVVDVGMHYKGWTREQGMDFMKSNIPLSELDLISEIDRYISWPGQALAYKIGELKLKALRAKAEEALGEKFDIRAFHDAVLANGAIPLTLLESEVDEWINTYIEGQQASAD